jgi:transcription antitermination factor NusG
MEKGQKVEILKGYFKGKIGIIDSISNDNILIKLSEFKYVSSNLKDIEFKIL